MEVKDIIEFDRRTVSAKSWLIGVGISSIPGFLFSLFVTGIYLGHDLTKSGQNTAGLVFILCFWFCGAALWMICVSKFSSVRNFPYRSEILQVRSQFKPLLSQFRGWLGSLRRIKKELKWAEWQLENSQASFGVLMQSFSTGLQVHKFAIMESGEQVCTLEGLYAHFTDNTAIQTYVSGSQTSGIMTQSHSNPENFRVSASTTSRVSSHRTGLAYVELSGGNFPTTVFAFSEPNEARIAANLINSLSTNFQSNLESKSDDLATWQEVILALGDELSKLLEHSAVLRAEICKLPKSLFLHELGEQVSEEEILYLKK